MNYLVEYKKLEKRFALDFVSHFRDENVLVNYPTEYQDIHEHWDLEILNCAELSGKYDVKGMRKVNRHDNNPNPTIQWLEILNVLGNKGWLLGKANYIVFEYILDWIIVDRFDIIKYLKNNIINQQSEYPEIFKLYTRRGRKDLITLVPFFDLMKMCKYIIPKK